MTAFRRQTYTPAAVEHTFNIALEVNGATRETPVSTAETLLETLRVRLGLTLSLIHI